MSTVKFILKNLNNTNVKLKIEPAFETGQLDAEELWQNPSTTLIPNKFVSLCMQAHTKSSIISCDGATNDTGFIDIDGQWALEINGTEVSNKTSLLELIEHLQNSGNFEVEVEDELEFSEDFEYLVISYSWRTGNGQDLDTRTSIIEPRRNTEVGWAKSPSDESYLVWGGDNTAGEGSEAVLINIKDLINDFPKLECARVLLKAFWFSSVGDGRFSLNFKSYKGGTMSPDNSFNFTNIGGTLIDNFTITCYTNSQDRDGVPLGALDIDLLNKRSTFTVLQNIQPLIQPPLDLVGVFSM